MSGFIAFLKSLFVSKQLSPREMAEEQIRRIEQAVMEYNSKDRSLHREKEIAVRAGREAEAAYKAKLRELDGCPDEDGSLARAELESAVAELEMEVDKAKSKMNLADGSILQNRKLLDGAEKTLIRLRGALEAGIPVAELRQMVTEVVEMGNRYDLAVEDVGSEIGDLYGSATEEAMRNRRAAAEKSAERKRESKIASDAGKRPMPANARSSNPMSSSQH